MSGFEVLEKTKAINRKTMVLVVSGYTEDSKKDEARQRGADGYFEKPLLLPEVMKVVQEAAARLPEP